MSKDVAVTDAVANNESRVTAHALKVLSAGAVKRGVAQIADDYQRQCGRPVTVQFDTAPNLARRLADGEAADVLVLPPHYIDELIASGGVASRPRGMIGRSRIGLIVRQGIAPPHIATVDAFAGVVGAADAIVYNSASSGLYVEQLLARLGLAAALRERGRKVNSGAAVMEKVAGHPGNAVGFGQLSEIRVQMDKGVAVQLAGPLPDAIQNATSYEAVVATSSRDAQLAAGLVAALSSQDARARFALTGID